MNTQIVQGSIGALAQENKRSIAETFMNADCIILVDTSGSMGTTDARGNQRRYDTACEELVKLQKSLPGKIAVFSFSNSADFCPGGVPTFQQGGTDMVRALEAVKFADMPGMRFILISDGEPDDPTRTLSIARQFTNHIDVIYVGSELSPTGRDFLTKLAAATGGQAVTAACANRLAENVRLLLGTGAHG